MAITYVNDLRLSEMGTGDNSGTWGTVTNTNLELIGDAFGYGTRAIANASTDNITIADGTADADRAMYLKLTGGGQACTVTLLPNTVSKVWMMENGTSADLTFTQGSGANVIIPAGDTKIIASDGAGSGAAVYDVFSSLSVIDLKVQDDLTVTDDVSIGGDLTVSGDNVTFQSANTDDPLITIKQTGNNTTSSRIYFVKDKGAAGADNDEIGKIQFIADNDAQEQISFVKQIATIADASDGAEGGKFQIQIASHDGELVDGLVLTDGSAEDEIDVTIASGTSSVTTVAGLLGVKGITPSAPLAVLANSSTYEGLELVTPSGDGSGEFHIGVHDSGGSAGRGLQIRRGGSDGMDTLSVSIDSAGSVGLGTSATNASSSFSNLFIGGNGYIYAETAVGASNSFSFSQNARFDTDNSWEYISTDEASNYYQSGGEHVWRYVASGTAGNDISWSEAMRIDNSGRVGIGTALMSSFYATKFVINVGDEDGITIYNDGANERAYIMFADDTSGTARFSGQISYDHSNDQMSFTTAAQTSVTIDGIKLGIGCSPATPFEVSDGTERYRIDFGTDVVYLMARNASAYIEAEYIATIHEFRGHGDDSGNLSLKINNDGNVGIGSTIPSTSYKFIVQNSTNQINQLNYNSNASFTQDLHAWDTIRAGTSAFNFGRMRTDVGGSPDSEFIFNGAGTASADGSWNGGGADYAEYFEWSDGNPSNQDRVGISVKLEGNKIVASSSDDDASEIIGVVSGNPAVVGDTAWNKWKDKYEKDDYNRYVMEEYTFTEWTTPATDTEDAVHHIYPTDYIPSDVTVPSDATVISTDDDGNKLMRKKLNSSYDKSATYLPRSERKEWDTVGLVGKLRMTKGQKTGTNWIKMRDISENVEEWLVK